jgi:hypothetical protein
MAGRRPWPLAGSARSGPASGTRWARSPAMRPDQPDQPGQSGQEILERSPGRWSPSRLGSMPRWLMMMISVLVLAGGVAAAVVAHGDRPGRGSLAGSEHGTVGSAATCREFIKLNGSAARERDCISSGKSVPAGIRLRLPAVCMRPQLQVGHRSVAIRPGSFRRRCYPVMPGTGHTSWPRRVITSWRSG